MNTCHNCGHENPDDYHICMKCAASLAALCPACGYRVPLGNNFCGNCGNRMQVEALPKSDVVDRTQKSMGEIKNFLEDFQAKMPSSMVKDLPDAAAESLGQRREVTVLFIDVTNITTSKSLGTEDAFIVMDELMDMMVDIIYRYEGIIDKFTGDGLMALFGIPLNHENDPERAVRAALEILDSARKLDSHQSIKFPLVSGIRIGINTGVVIAGKLGSELHMEYTVIGDTVNLASRLVENATPGTTLISFQSYKRVRHIFSIVILPPIIAKGYPQPIQVYRPTGLRRKPLVVRGETGFKSPMIGREGPCNLLREALSKTQRDKRPQIIKLSGEAGLGKTRLITEFRKSISGFTAKVHYGSCDSFTRVTPYHVIRRMLRNIMHISETDSTRDQTDTVLGHFEFLGLDQEETLPYIINVLGLPQTNQLSDARIRILDSTAMQRQTHTALKDFLTAEAGFSTNTILFFDDLHWVDQASKEFLEYFSLAVDNIGILLILVSRDFSTAPILHPLPSSILKSNGRLSEICLQPLTIEETRSLIDNIIQETEPEVDRAKDMVSQRAEGNPYFTEELIQVLIENEGLVRVDGRWQTTASMEAVVNEIPETLKDIIISRFDHLPEHLRHVLQKSAILGPSFALFLLQTQVDEDDETLLEYLSALESREFLIGSSQGMDVVYTFKQSIVRDTIYNTILKKDRRVYHSQVAQTIKTFTFWLAGEKNEILAYHLSESAQPLAAMPFLIAAGEKAAERFANKIAIKHYRDALTLIQGSDDIQPLDLARIQIGLGKALKYAGEFEEVAEVLQAGIDQLVNHYSSAAAQEDNLIDLLIDGFREMADLRAKEGRLDDGLTLLETGIAILGRDPEIHYPNLWRRLIDRVAWIYFRQGKLDQASETAELALANAHIWGLDDPITLGSLNNTMGGINWMQSRYDKAIEYVQESHEINNRLNYHWGKAIASTNLGVLHFSSGNWTAALSNFEDAEVIQVEQGYTPDRPTNLKNLGEVLMNLGDHKTSRKHLTASQEISNQLGMTIEEAYAEIGLCRLSIYESKFDEAEEHLRKASDLLDDFKDQVDDRNISLMLLEAMILSANGEIKTGLTLCIEALKMAEEGGFQAEKSDAHRVLGSLCTQAGRFDQAETALKAGIQLAVDHDNPYREARAHYELGCLYEVQIRQTDTIIDQLNWSQKAQFELNLAIEQFTTLGAQ